VISVIVTLIAVGVFIAGVRSLNSLKRLDDATGSERSDPFYTSVALLFSTSPRDAKFRSRQRRTIWLFCGAILLLYFARIVYVQGTI